MQNKKYNHILLLILAVVIGLGILLRLYNLGGESLWMDEAASFYRGQMSVREIFEASYSWDAHPPTYYLTLHLLSKWNQSETWLRLFSVVWGILMLPLFYLYSRRMLGKTGSLISVLLLSLSVFHIWFSQEVRVYTLFAGISLCALYFFYRAVTDQHKRDWIWCAVFSIVNFYIHYFSLVLLGAQVVTYCLMLIGDRKPGNFFARQKNAVTACLIMLIGFLPQITFFVGQTSERITKSSGTFEVMNPLQFVQVFLKRMVNPLTLPHPLLESGVKYLFALIILIGILTGWKKYKKAILFNVSIIFFSLLFSWISTWVIYFSGSFRFVVFLIAPFLFLVALSVVAISERVDAVTASQKRIPGMVAGAVVLILVVFVNVYLVAHYFQTPKKPDWRNGVDKLIEVASTEMPVYPIPDWSDYVVRYYLLQKKSSLQTTRTGDTVSVAKMDSLATGHPQAIFFTDGHLHNPSLRRDIYRWLSDHADRIWQDPNFPRSALWRVRSDSARMSE